MLVIRECERVEKTIFVVEGKNDANALRNAGVMCPIVTTNGSRVSKNTLSYLKLLEKDHTIIVLTDPDYPGQRIRSIIEAHLSCSQHIFIEKKYCIAGKKVGIEHVDIKRLQNAIKDIKTYQHENETLTYDDFLSLKLTGIDSKIRREMLCKQLNIGYCNAKTLFKRLNYLSCTKVQLEKILGDRK